MYPLQLCDLVVEEPSVLQRDLAKINKFLNGSTKKRRRISGLGGHKTKDNKQADPKKLMHREIERHRRREMANLYASLRTLLPLEYIKGKRSVCDHMHEAVNYIKHMEMKIQELKVQQDKLKKKSNTNASNNGSSNTTNKKVENNVIVNHCRDGVEILINIGIKDGFPISKLLMELLKMGLNIVCCISCRENDRFIYKIQSQVNETSYVNMPKLQERLVSVVDQLYRKMNVVSFDVVHPSC